jgi:ABC-type Fe3+-hydroxamate transport system substrate-binding protein
MRSQFVFNGAAIYKVLYIILGALTVALACFAPGVVPRPDNPDAFIVRDMTGRDVRLKGPPENIMLFHTIGQHYLMVAQSVKKLKGAPLYVQNFARESMLGDLFPEFLRSDTLFSLGTAPLNAETALQFDTDALLAWHTNADRFTAIGYPNLINIANFNGDEPSLYRLLGDLTQNRERVDWLWQRFAGKMDQAYALAPQDKPPVKVLALGRDYHIWNRYSIDYNHDLIMLNAVNMASNIFNPRANVNIEAIISFNPDVILMSDYSSTIAVNDIYANPVLQPLKAVLDRRVYRMPRGAAQMAGPIERPLLVFWTCLVLHPEVIPPEPFRQEVRNTYMETFGFEMSEAQLDAFLNMKQNAGSFGYERFKVL